MSSIPACITRDNLTSPYWPNTSRTALWSIVVLGAVFLFTGFNRLNHSDLWAHVNFGHWIATHRALPAIDPFAANPSQSLVLNSAWLSQLLFFATYANLGNEGLVLVHSLLVSLTAGVLMLATYRRGVSGVFAAMAGLAFLLLALPIVGTVRPQLFGQLGLALFLLAIAELPRRKRALLWLPLVAALWANLHGSLPIGLAVLAIHALANTINVWSRNGNLLDRPTTNDVMFLWFALAISTLAGCVNPHGPAIYAEILGFGRHAALAAVSEWRALTAASLTGTLFLLSLALTAVVARYSNRRWPLSDVLLLAIFGISLLTAIRMQAWWALVWPFTIWPHANAVWMRSAGSDRVPATPVAEHQPTAMRTLVATGFIFMTLVVAPPTFSFIAGRARGEGLILSSDTPIYVADEAIRRNLAGGIAAPFDWSDFLTFKTGGQLKPLVHTHVHLASQSSWQAYEAIFRGDPDWLASLKQQQMRYLLVPRGRAANLAKLVQNEDRSNRNQLRIIYQDQRCVLAEIVL